MKMKKIALAVASLALAQSAFAVNLTTGVDNVFYIGGASAQTPGLARAVVKFCNPAGTLKTYLDTIDGKQAVVWTCSSATAASGLTVGSSFVIAKVDAGGSWAGVDPTVNHTQLRFPDLANAVDTVPSYTNSGITAGTLTGTVPWDDTTTTGTSGTLKGTLAYPQFSFSDVSVNTFKARGKAITGTNWTAKGAFAGQGFGVIVSPSLYTALQKDQGISTSCAATDGSCQPSISKDQYANVVYGTRGFLQNLLPNTTLSGSETFRISRRSDSSGTQAASDSYFLNKPCNSGTTLGGGLTPKASNFTDGGVGTATTVVAESSTGNVKTNVSTAAGFAIGVVSLENLESSIGGAKYVKINNVSPNYANGSPDTTQKINAVNGLYDFAYESMLVISTTEAPANSAADKLAELGFLADQGNGANLTTSTGLFGDPASATKAALGSTGNTTGSLHTSNYSRGQNECKARLYYY